MNRIPSLDGFRAISIILVLFCHSRLSVGFPAALSEIAKQAEVGVTIFFVISGFLITNLLLNEELKTGLINIRAFYLRRIFRIMPVYFLYFAFILIWRHIENIGLSTTNVIHAATFTVNFDQKKDWFLGHFWSLSVEEQFYLFWPAMLMFFRKNLKAALIVLILYSCLARVIAYKFPSYALLSLSPFFKFADAIFVGAFGGILFFEQPQLFKNKLLSAYPAQGAAALLFLLFIYFTEHGKLAIISLPFGNLIISISILFLIAAYIFPSDKLIFKILNHKILIHIGILSYSIYIWQEFFFTGSIKTLWRTFPFNIAIIYIVALASYNLWEKPFLRLKKHFSPAMLSPVI